MGRIITPFPVTFPIPHPLKRDGVNGENRNFRKVPQWGKWGKCGHLEFIGFYWYKPFTNACALGVNGGCHE